VVRAVAESAMARRSDGKLHLDRVRVASRDGRYFAGRSGAQYSNVLSAAAAANGLALLPDGDGVPEGGDVDVMRLDWPADH
jgi:molybdopterin molybdotransferase